jgi:hypothetical protein
MNKVEHKKNKSLFIDLNDKKSDNSLSDQFTELQKSGYTRANLDVRGSAVKKNVKLKVAIDLFRRIKEIQDLPDWVIIKLILAERKLKESSFKNRFPND